MTTPSAPNAPQDANERIDAIGDEHVGTSIDTPLRPDAFDLSDEAKIKAIESKFRDIMEIMGLDLTDDSLAGTPLRVAKMYVQEPPSEWRRRLQPAVWTRESHGAP